MSVSRWVELNHEEELFLRGSRCERCEHLMSLHQMLVGMRLFCLVCMGRKKPATTCGGGR